jgi:hypothetical protein
VPETPITIPGKHRVAPPAAAPARRVVRAYSLTIGDEVIPLEPGIITLGRSSRCDVILEEHEVSRCHARLVVSPLGVVVEDNASCNGVFVNGDRIGTTRTVDDGDRIVIGSVELTLRATYRVSSAMPAVRLPPAPAPAPTPETERLDTPAPSTSPRRRTDAFNELARLSERMLTMGRPEVALELVSKRLHGLLDALREGEQVSSRMLESATSQALRLAVANSKPRCVELALELCLLAKRAMSDESIELLERALNEVPGLDSSLLFFYQQALHARYEELGPFDRIRADRIMSLRCKD